MRPAGSCGPTLGAPRMPADLVRHALSSTFYTVPLPQRKTRDNIVRAGRTGPAGSRMRAGEPCGPWVRCKYTEGADFYVAISAVAGSQARRLQD